MASPDPSAASILEACGVQFGTISGSEIGEETLLIGVHVRVTVPQMDGLSTLRVSLPAALPGLIDEWLWASVLVPGWKLACDVLVLGSRCSGLLRSPCRMGDVP